MATLVAVRRGQVPDDRNPLVLAGVAAVVNTIRVQAEAQRVGIKSEFFGDTQK